MESGQFEGYCYRGIGNAHYIRDEPRNGIGERIEQNQHPDHTEYIKGKMCQSRPSGLRITGQSRQVGRNRCSYIFTQYECHTQLVVDPAVGTHNQRNGHRCSWSLHDHGQDSPDKQEQDREKSHIGIILHEGKHLRIGSEIRSIGFQGLKPHKKERETENELPDRLTWAFAGKEEWNAECE